ncbi:MAG: tetratricopeptide repeat protein [Oligoflexus sp.]
MKNWLPTVILSLSFLLGIGETYAQSKSRRRAPSQTSILEKQVENVIRNYRTGRSGVAATWASASNLEQRFHHMNKRSKLRLRQLQASLAARAEYPILSATYAADSILISGQFFHKANTHMWRLLAETSKVRPIQYILEDLATKLIGEKNLPPEFGNDWHYIIGNAYWEGGKNDLAARHYEQLTMQDRYYMPAQFHLGIIRFIQGKNDEAEARLKSVIDPSSREVTPLAGSNKVDMWNYTNMTLGRIYYEQRDFLKAAQHYRKVTKSSSLFYDALFEQSWALFLGGSPKHALGSLYGVHSPYFKGLFNPETKVLESMIYFWMCRYDEARNALADFAENHGEAVESLSKFLDRKRLGAETAYQLFENLISGVSSESLGLPRNVLLTAAERDSMLLVRDQFATVVSELDRLESIGFFGVTSGLDPQKALLETISSTLRKTIGDKFLRELRALKAHYDELYTQSQFLYLELLMSQKEHLLGRELHADTRVRAAASKESIKDWSFRSQSWEDDKEEYWWDEIGFQIIDVDPQCN